MEEQEESRRPQGVEPAVGGRQRGRAVPLQFPDSHLRRRRRQFRVEMVEPGSNPGFFPQHIRGNKTAGHIPGRTDHRGQERLARRNREADVVAHAVLEGEPAGEDRDMRGKRLWRVGVGVLEDDPAGGERIDRRRTHAPVTVHGKVVRPSVSIEIRIRGPDAGDRKFRHHHASTVSRATPTTATPPATFGPKPAACPWGVGAFGRASCKLSSPRTAVTPADSTTPQSTT